MGRHFFVGCLPDVDGEAMRWRCPARPAIDWRFANVPGNRFAACRLPWCAWNATARAVGKPKSGNVTGLDTVADRAAQSGAGTPSPRLIRRLRNEEPPRWAVAKIGKNAV